MKRLAAPVALIVLAISCAEGTSFAQTPPPADPVPAQGTVNIFRDTFGVPHVYAANEEEAFFGIGYALAEDNLSSILYRYAAISGKLSEIDGKFYVPNDLFVRKFNVAAEAQAAFQSADPFIVNAYTHFMNGIAQFMADEPTQIPSWWSGLGISLQPQLIIQLGHWAALTANALHAFVDCRSGAAGPDAVDDVLQVDKFVLTTVPPSPEDVRFGSNIMVLGTSSTATGEIFFSTDNHSRASSERNEIRVHAGTLQTMGIVSAGGVLPTVGHTANLAWGVTSGGPDTGDCYKFEIDPGDANRYLIGEAPNQQSVAFTKKTVIIDPSDDVPQNIEVRYVSKNGLDIPVIGEHVGFVYAAALGYQGRAGVTDATVLLLNLANNIGDAKTALSHGGLGPFNVMAADTSGGMYYVRQGLVPRRSASFNWKAPVDGHVAATDWVSSAGSVYHAFADLVDVENPAADYMQNNNVTVDKMLHADDLPAELNPALYPGYIVNGINGTHDRGVRAIEMLRPYSNAGTATLQDFGDVVMDEKWIKANLWSNALKGAVENETNWNSKPQDVQDMATRIINFDGFAAHTSIAALNYWYWLYFIDEVSPPNSSLDIVNAVLAAQTLTNEQRAILIASLEAVVGAMNAEFGTTEVMLGHVFAVGRGMVREPLGGVTALVGGHREPTLRAFDHGFGPSGPPLQTMINGQRNPMLMVLSGTGIFSGTSVPFGQSNDPNSPHYSDQSALFRDKVLKPSYFEYADLKNNLEGWYSVQVTAQP